MGLNGVVSGYPTSTNLPRVDELSTDPQDFGRHIYCYLSKSILILYYVN